MAKRAVNTKAPSVKRGRPRKAPAPQETPATVAVPPRDQINPPHYTQLSPEPIDVIEGWGLNYRLGNAAKYLARAGRKGDRLTDLKKCRWYLEREIAAMEGDAPASK